MISDPFHLITPDVKGINPANAFNMVDLPAPEGPTIEISEPLSISKSAVNLKPPKSTNKFLT